jgi:hypothetical protein
MCKLIILANVAKIFQTTIDPANTLSPMVLAMQDFDNACTRNITLPVNFECTDHGMHSQGVESKLAKCCHIHATNIFSRSTTRRF